MFWAFFLIPYFRLDRLQRGLQRRGNLPEMNV